MYNQGWKLSISLSDKENMASMDQISTCPQEAVNCFLNWNPESTGDTESIHKKWRVGDRTHYGKRLNATKSKAGDTCRIRQKGLRVTGQLTWCWEQ